MIITMIVIAQPPCNHYHYSHQWDVGSQVFTCASLHFTSVLYAQTVRPQMVWS